MKTAALLLCLALPVAAQPAGPADPAPDLATDAATDPAAPAVANAPRVWVALSGDRLRLDGTAYRLSGVTCPAPETAPGRAAKALLNTFLRNGYVACRVAGGQAACHKQGRDFAQGLIASGHCAAAPGPDMPADAIRLVRDTRLRLPARGGYADTQQRRCTPSDLFLDRARAAACDSGLPFSLCRGRSGLRQFGRPVAPSNRFHASGDTAPAFNPFECR